MGQDAASFGAKCRIQLACTLALASSLLGGCAGFHGIVERLGHSNEPESAPTGWRDRSAGDAEIYRNAQRIYARYLEREVERLRADLRQAEEAMVAIESGLRGVHSRADAVSSLAEARIAVERAGRDVPWRETQIEEARGKLKEAERQFQAGHSGSAVFFASRARRIADTLNEEAELVSRSPDALFVERDRVNLRSGPSTADPVLAVLEHSTPVFPERSEGEWMLVRTPSGPVGWVYHRLLRGR